MRAFVLMALAALPAFGQHTLYASVSNAKNYVVGAKLSPSGVFRRSVGKWQHVGFNHPFTYSLAAPESGEGPLYLAAGNGLIRIPGGEGRWKILTGSDVTEIRDAAVDPHNAKQLYFSHSRGIAASANAGETWRDATGDLKHKYVESVRIDREHESVLLAATEAGIFRSQDGGAHWVLSGASGFQVLRVEQSPTVACRWIATTEQGGIFASSDCGVSFENVGGQIGVDRNLYDLAWDQSRAHRVAVAGFAFGIAVSEDDGVHWEFRNAGLPRMDAWSVAWDPDHAGRIYASIHEEAVFVSDDAGKTWRADGLPGSSANRLLFVKQAVKQ